MDYENEVVCYFQFFDAYIIAKFETLVRIVNALNTELDRIGLLDVWHVFSIIDEHLDNEHKLGYEETPISHDLVFFASNDKGLVFDLCIRFEEYMKETRASYVIDIDPGYLYYLGEES